MGQKKGRPEAAELGVAAALLAAAVIFLRPLSGLEEYVSVPLLDPAGILQVYPWVDYNARELGRGCFPLWNPGTGLGQPHLGNIQTGTFFPFWWLWMALGGTPALYGALLLFRLWLAGMFWFMFVRRTVCSLGGALLAAVGYAAGGYCLWFCQLIDLNSQMLLPLLLLALSALSRRPRRETFFASALLIALAILGGHPEAAFITVAVAGAYAFTAWAIVFRRREKGGKEGRRRQEHEHPFFRWVVLQAGAAVLGLALTAAAVLPFLNYLSRSWTMHGSGFGFFHLDPRGFFNLIVAGIHSLFTDMPQEIPVEYINAGALRMLFLPYSETAVPGNIPGAGPVICVLALVAILKLRRLPWPAFFFVALLAVSLGLTFGLPGFRLIALVPPFNMNSNFKFFFSEIHAALAVLAGVGFDQLGKAAGQKRSGQKNLRAGVKMFIALIFLAGLYLNRLSVSPYLSFARPAEEHVQELRKEVGRKGTGEERILGIENYWPANLALPSGLKELRSSDALFYRPYVELLNRINGLSPAESLDYFYPSYFMGPSPDRLLCPEAPFLALAGVLSQSQWLPHSVIDFALLKGRAVAPAARPSREIFRSPASAGERAVYGDEVSTAGLFLHPPGQLTFSLDEAAELASQENDDTAPAKGSNSPLSFFPAFLLPSSAKGNQSDGVICQVMQRREGELRMSYSRFVRPSGAGEAVFYLAAPVVIEAKAASEIVLSSLPGPRNQPDNDWFGFAALSWHPAGYEQPPLPTWSAGLTGPHFYAVPHRPWAHAEESDEPRAAARACGDRVSVDVWGLDGQTLVIHEVWYPGWEAEIDGWPARIEIPSDKASWGVSLPSGVKKVDFYFVPRDFRIGLYFTLVSLLCLLLISFVRPKPIANTGLH